MSHRKHGSLLAALALLSLARPPAGLAGPIAYVSRGGEDATEGSILMLDTDRALPTGSIALPRGAAGLALDVTGTRLYVVTVCTPLPEEDECVDGGIVVVDLATRSVVADIPVEGFPSAVTLDPSRSRAYVLDQETGRVTAVDLAAGAVLGTVERSILLTPVLGLAVHPLTGAVYAGEDRGVSVIDPLSLTVTQTIMLGFGPTDLLFDASGERMLMLSAGSVSVVDPVSGAETVTIAVPADATAFVLHPDGRRLFVANDCDPFDLDTCTSTISVVDLAAGGIQKTIALASSTQALAIEASGARVFALNANTRTLSVIDAVSEELVATIAVGERAVAVAVASTFPTCGNGVADPGEPCADPVDVGICDAACSPPKLGGRWQLAVAGCIVNDENEVNCFAGPPGPGRVRQRGNQLAATFLSGRSQGGTSGCRTSCSPGTPGCRERWKLRGTIADRTVQFMVTMKQSYRTRCQVRGVGGGVHGKSKVVATYRGKIGPDGRSALGDVELNADLDCTGTGALSGRVTCHDSTLRGTFALDVTGK